MPTDPEAAEDRAAGGVVWRRAGEAVEALVVHRPHYDDWSLPKGKLEAGESWEDAAVREVEEEVGLRCALGDELTPISYTPRDGRAKVVRYWLMEAVDAHDFRPNDEVDAVRWLAGPAAVAALTYATDRGVMAEALERLALSASGA